jgi:anti-sigma B factor antagonist
MRFPTGATMTRPEPARTGSLRGRWPMLVPSLDLLSIEVRDEERQVVVTLTGEADISTGRLLAGTLAHVSSGHPSHVVLDVGALRFIDANSIGLIVGAVHRLREQDADLVVRSPTPMLRRLLAILKLSDLVEQLALPRCTRHRTGDLMSALPVAP